MHSAETGNPLAPSEAQLHRIRVRAYHLWESEGRPGGQAETYWERARELDALESGHPALMPDDAAIPVRRTADGTVIEEAFLQENLGEFPSLLTDRGNTMQAPESREIAREFRDGER